MKIIDSLTTQQLDGINNLVNTYKKNNEFEVSLFSNPATCSHLLTLEKFNNLNSVFAKVTSSSSTKPQYTTSLDVIMSLNSNTNQIVNYRITINGIASINKFMSMLHERKNHLIISVLTGHYLDQEDPSKINIQMMKKTKNVSNYITIEDVFMKVKMDTEEDIPDTILEKLSNVNKNWDPTEYTIFYRYKERATYFVEKPGNIFRIDLTTTKTSKNINNVEITVPKYEIEIECDIKDKKKFTEQLFTICEFVIKSVQGSQYIITKTTIDNVLDKYRELVNVDKSRSNLYARQPVSLEVLHLVDYLPNKYAVTDKADGDRSYLLIYEKRCYLISTNLIVKDTGLNVKDESLNGSIIDGELIFLPKYNRFLFMGFDCVLKGSQNVRDESKFTKRLEYMDSIVYSINKCGYEHKSIYQSNIDYSNLTQVCEYHKRNLIEFYDDIQKELNTKSTSMIVRRKYFMETLGVADNEIFKYTNLLWNSITTDSSVKYPYSHDGLIYHPNEQKYVVDPDKSKYPEFKLKPPKKNSIDLYTVFEKDKETKKVLIVYDNSIKDIVKNKPYIIANLYVGLTSKGVEKPVLFGEKYGVSQAYIFLDDANVPRSQDGKIILDNTVVEYYFNLDLDLPNPYKWVPMKTRWDKTESVQKFSRRYGNALRTAEAVWRSITNPIMMSDFTSLSSDNFDTVFKSFQEKINYSVVRLEKKQNVYFQKKSDLVYNMAQFHHYIKSNLIYTYMMYKYNDDIQCKVLDLGCGRGADINKFYYTEVELYVGIDPDAEALNDSFDGAIARYKNIKKGKDRFPPMFFINANAGVHLQYWEQIKSIGRMNNDMKRMFERFFTWDSSRTIFDRINCQFVIHYLFSDEITWNNYCENINMYLREGGYFVFTTFDGNKVKEKLKGVDHYIEYYEENGEKKVLFDIVKKYDDNSTEPFGNAIDVHMSWLFDDDVYQTEYLVYPEFIIDSLQKNCSMELVETCTFEEIFHDSKEFLTLGSEIEPSVRIKTFQKFSQFYKPTEINTKCYGYSFLNRFYIFRKKEFDLERVKRDYYGHNRHRINKSTEQHTAKAKLVQKKMVMQKEARKEVSDML